MNIAIARVASAQHGIVTTRQLVAAGLSRQAISKRVRAGQLYRVHQGVYSVGHHGLGQEARWLAAVLTGGPGAALSHGSAAVHWDLLRPLQGPIDVSVPSRNGRARRRGVRIHRRPDLETDGTRSDLERDFLRLWRRHRLPRPEVNVPIGQMTVDFLWRKERLVVETDSYVTHGGTIAFEDDRTRDLQLRRRGSPVDAGRLCQPLVCKIDQPPALNP